MADDKRTASGPPSGGSDRNETPAPQEQEIVTEQPPNETVPGGRYSVGGQTVDAEGRPLSEDA